MNLKNFVEGITILQPYYDMPDGYHLGAEHDQIFLYATSRPVSDEDVKKLRELGWFQSEVLTDDDEKPVYDPTEGWSAYV